MLFKMILVVIQVVVIRSKDHSMHFTEMADPVSMWKILLGLDESNMASSVCHSIPRQDQRAQDKLAAQALVIPQPQ